MLKPKLTWEIKQNGKRLWVGEHHFGDYYEANGKFFVRTSDQWNDEFAPKSKAIAKLKEMALEFFESVIEGATDES